MKAMLRCLIVVLASALSVATHASNARAHEVGFSERVRAQLAILDVYQHHQIGRVGSREPIPYEVAERQVIEYLKQSAALEKFWNTKITAEMLDRETDRIARRTRMPDRLRELYAALGDDPVIVKECLVRPVLVSRLIGSFFNADRRVHGERFKEAQNIRTALVAGNLEPTGREFARYQEEILAEARRQQGAPRDRAVRPPKDGATVQRQVPPDEFDRLRESLPTRVGEPGSIIEHESSFEIPVVQNRTEDQVRVVRYVVRKVAWQDWWSEAESLLDAGTVATVAGSSSLPPPREASTLEACGDLWDNGSLDDVPDGSQNARGVFTGSLVIVWGGYAGTGGRYDPATDSWTRISTIGEPSTRASFTAVWTGTEMIVWGGNYSPLPEPALATGGRYNPITDKWTPTSTLGAPIGRSFHTAVWTGSEMIVWGGDDSQSITLSSGGRYNPATDSWTLTSMTGAPIARDQHTAVWTGSRMVIWGGLTESNAPLGDGGQYDPSTDTWSPVSSTRAPAARYFHTAVWTGSRMVVWGGLNGSTTINTGGRYDPANDSWSRLSTNGAPAARYRHTAVWSGSEMIVWGGRPSDPEPPPFDTGGRYDPESDRWRATSTTNAPSARSGHVAVFASNFMIVWAGDSEAGNTGGRYDPATDTWTPTSTADAPEARSMFSAVWTGSQMIIWGGYAHSLALNGGGRYDPVLDAWSATTTVSAPSVRYGHSAVWTGSRMIVWGGDAGGGIPLGDGRRYDPISDSWEAISSVGAPSPRVYHTAVWTGNRMVVWGGNSLMGKDLNTGGRYDPVADAWAPTSIVNVPQERIGHTAVWTGTLMIVWGAGADEGGWPLNTGGRYDPVADQWWPTTTVGAPGPRRGHSAVWTGTQMIIWSGDVGTGMDFWVDGGRYDPILDSWTPTSYPNVLDGRTGHQAVWTGSQMIVWGGTNPFPYGLDLGGLRYDPITDQWLGVSKVNEPLPRIGHAQLWTGSQMIVWGGGSLSTGGRYVPGPDPPREVPALSMLNLDSSVALSWTAIAGATAYDSVRGGLSALRDSGGDFTAATHTCLGNDLAATSIEDPEHPVSGDGFWYLVRGVNCGGPGTYDDGGAAQAASRDAGIAASGLACP